MKANDSKMTVTKVKDLLSIDNGMDGWMDEWMEWAFSMSLRLTQGEGIIDI